MNPSNNLLFFSFFATLCFTQVIIKPFEPDESALVVAAAQILKSCYGNRITPVGLAGNSSELITRVLKSQEILSVTNIRADARFVDNGPVHSGNRYKLEVFVVTASSSLILTKTLGHIKASLWWNHMAAFLIVDWSLSDGGCSNAYEMLWAIWEMDILNANVICRHQTRARLLIYTFNPYKGQAPHPWRIDKTYGGKNDHPWTVFVRDYEEDEGVCEGLDFEKTNDLSGYEIRVSVVEGSCGTKRPESERIRFRVLENTVCKILFPALKATPKVLMHSSVDSIGYVDSKGNISGILQEVALGFSDFGALSRSVRGLSNLTTAYPHEQIYIRALTQYNGYRSQLSKICSVIDPFSRYSLILVIGITILFFKYFVRESVSVSILSTLRVICDSSLPTISRRLPPRIYLGSLFLFALTMQGIYQGQLASLLTHEKPLRNVKTMKDLAESDHTVYGSKSYRSFFRGPRFDGRYVDMHECTQYVVNDSRAACISSNAGILYDGATLKLHMSNTMLTLLAALPIRPDWPLEDRVNTLLSRSVESHQIQYLYHNATYKLWHLIESHENQRKDLTPKVLTLHQLKFAFAILGIGLGCGAICFIVEVSLGRARP